MRRSASVAAVLLAACVPAACTREATAPAPAPSALVGAWGAGPVALGSAGTLYQSLSFGADGRFQQTVSTHGAATGQPAGLSSTQRTTGTYRTAADGSITFAADSLVTWDALTGAAPAVVRTPYPFTPGPFDGARYEVSGARLTLRYTTYPADGPVATTLTLYRVLPD